MKAAIYQTTGPAPDVLTTAEVPTPEPGPGEVRVRVHVHGVNPTDCKRRAGARGPIPHDRVIPGYDAAGVIHAVGADVDPGRVGQRVWIWEGAHQKWDGAAAEFVVVPDSRAMPLPDSADFALGASLGVPGMTAAHALRLGGPLAGETVLVTGGAGAVGCAAVAIAKHMGAQVIATVRDEARRADAEAAGADAVVGGDLKEIEARVKQLTGGAGVRCMVDVDLGAHLERSWRWVAINGTLSSYGSASDPAPTLDWPKFMYRNIAIRGVAIFEVEEADKRAAAAAVQAVLEAGAFPHRVDSTYAFDDIAQAHARQEEGRPRGKVLVEIG